jgi:hypothetical protein
MASHLEAQHVPPAVAQEVADAPPVGSLFAAFLGYNPMGTLLPPQVLHNLPAHNAAVVTGKSFFPNLLSGPFLHGLKIAFTFSLILFLLAALASWLRGGKYIHQEEDAVTNSDQAKAVDEVVGA